MDNLFGLRRRGSKRANPTEESRLSHDMRQSLAVVRTLLFLVENTPQLGDEASEHLRVVQNEVDWIEQMLLAYERQERTAMPVRLVEVGDVVRRASASVAMSTQCQVRLYREPGVHALTEEVGLRRSVRNLIENAVRAAGTDGHVDIRVRAQGGDAVVQVCDDGPGFGRMPAQQGLGLATVKSFVSRFNGSLEAGPGYLGGALLTLRLPGALPSLSEQRTSA